jgi:hypothetical protein
MAVETSKQDAAMATATPAGAAPDSDEIVFSVKAFNDFWKLFKKTQAEWEEERKKEAVERQAEADKREKERQLEAAEWQTRLQKEAAERQKEEAERKKESDAITAEMRKNIAEASRISAETSRNMGGLNNTWGLLVEEMVSANICEKFSSLGFTFTEAARRKVFRVDGKVFAESDIFLENGLYAMPVESKAKLTVEDVNDHLERIALIRQYMDKHDDKRKLVGAAAGGIVSDDVLNYAQKKGLFVLVQSGDSIELSATRKGFKPREW